MAILKLPHAGTQSSPHSAPTRSQGGPQPCSLNAVKEEKVDSALKEKVPNPHIEETSLSSQSSREKLKKAAPSKPTRYPRSDSELVQR